MAGDPRTRDPNEPMPIIPDKRYDADKPVGYEVKEGPQYLDASCEGCTDCPCKTPDLDVDPFEDVPGYYSESGDIHEELPVTLSSIRNPHLRGALAGLCVEYHKASRAYRSAVRQASKGSPVLSSFNTLRAWGTMMEDAEWSGLTRSASKRKLASEEGFQERLRHLFRRRAEDILAYYTERPQHSEAFRVCAAATGGSPEDLKVELDRCVEAGFNPVEIQRVAWVLEEFGPGSPHYEGASDLTRKLQVWALPELRLSDGL